MSHLKSAFDVVIRSTYSPKVRCDIDYFEPTLTKQCFQDECDIDSILAKYSNTGVLDHVRTNQGNYGDFLNVQDYHASVNQVIAAQEMFMSLPAQVRARFANDPGQFLHFVGDVNNRDEMAKLGLLKPEVVEELNKKNAVPKDTLKGGIAEGEGA